MNNLSLFLIVAMSAISLVACNDKNGEGKDSGIIRNAAQNAVSRTVSTVKDVTGGITEGVTQGRQDSAGADGAVIVTNNEQLAAQKLTLELLKIEKAGDDQVSVQIGFKNPGDKIVRLIDLQNTGALLLIDRDGYATGLVSGTPADVTIPAMAGSKVDFKFTGKANNVESVRLWGNTLKLKAKS